MIRKLARPMLASVYIADGVKTVTNSSEYAGDAERVVNTIKSVLPSQYAQYIPSDPETVAKINGGLKIGAGSTFALGKAPRLSAGLLAASTVGTLLGRNAFWEAKNEDEKTRRRNGAMTNVALLGGVLLASADTEGKPGLAWRAQDAAKRANKNIQQALPTQSETDKAKKKASDWFQDTAETVSERAQQVADQVTDYVDDNKDDWKKTATKFADKAADTASTFADDASDWAEDTYKDLKPGKVEQYKAKRKVNSLVGDLQSNLDDLGPSEWEKFKGKRKVNKAADKAQGKAQDAIDRLQESFENLDASPSWRQKRKWKKKAKKAEKKANKLVKKAEKKFN
ncbi:MULTISPECIES: DoxX family membrane protein [unclassified Corynebacterium]|uniref:DoxX family membrane protein n=1 Tax=unclassified Corynebacterium TaxID=2624378 RepID=UPI0021AACCA7|nr:MULTISPECIES: DoxX family membrane protein [unclassified Corynebacterium]MCT1452868.1 DoxX family membrane protein [Corynebacterium sp. p3-SID1145]MCT1461895.1 DoxX family membrane protein [Corynebacterium sp. p3-SID1140]MDN8594642.1 DoxX family membrane protein [Corynebacterium sp. P4_F2]WKK56151.1 DoxX family membrane protein [Corynebacterium sp. P4-C1]WKK63563.1 DoxX family membrane protein [Corynebacterium sp. P8-C1]